MLSDKENVLCLQEVLRWLHDGFNGVLLAFGGASGIRGTALFGGGEAGVQALLSWLASQLLAHPSTQIAVSCWELRDGGQHDLLQPHAQVMRLLSSSHQ